MVIDKVHPIIAPLTFHIWS